MMNTTTKTQTRGVCQCCGREQAVLASGRMSKHGYTVDHGWFNGVCSGQRYEPLQISRVETDRTIAAIRAEVIVLRKLALDLRAGRVIPTTAQGDYKRQPNGKWGYEMIAWADAAECTRTKDIARRAASAENRADNGVSFANDLAALADKVHGTELRTVVLEAGPAPIAAGERRMLRGKVLIAKCAEKGRVTWKSEAGTFTSWLGVAAWRKLPAGRRGAQGCRQVSCRARRRGRCARAGTARRWDHRVRGPTMNYIVFFVYDDAKGSTGRCRTDHTLEKGDLFYAKHGRAIVRSCITDRAVDNTFRRNARTLAALAR